MANCLSKLYRKPLKTENIIKPIGHVSTHVNQRKRNKIDF